MTDAPGRNAPCPCGSKKKYKACCWEDDRAKRSEAQQAAFAAQPSHAAADTKPAKPRTGFFAELKDRHPGKKR